MSTPPGRAVAPVIASLATAAVLGLLLWLQSARGGWPFAASPPAPAVDRHAGHEPASMAPAEAIDDRVPVDATHAMQSLGVRVDAVRRETLTQALQAVATVVPDESRISHAHTRVAGWVERLDVNTTGESVRAGQPLARVFSQELLSSQTEYLAARAATASSGITSAVVASGRARLSVLGMAEEEIAAIEASGQPHRLVTVVAPHGGVVVNRGVTEGTAVDPSTPLLTIADLSRVWVFAEIPEANIPAVRVGIEARLDFPGSGLPPIPARVDFLYPTLTERTRTLRVRFTVANRRGTLRPGLYGTATLALPGATALTIPRDAVVDTGRQQHVFVATGGGFEPRPVTLGLRLTDRVEVLDGLREGERVVSSGVFLLDSESRLRATGGMGGHSHGTTPAAEPPPAVAPSEPPARPMAPVPGTRPRDPQAGPRAPASPPPDPHAGHRAPGAAPADPHAGHRE
jgi:Cu(I)/Ag(I) efflux system membrane fusion protein